MADIEGFLTELARAVQRYGMYPDGHPARTSTATGVHDRLLDLLRGRSDLTLKVTRDRIICDEEGTDPENTLLAAFARRLHSHQLHLVTFREGIGCEELAGLLGAIAVPAGSMGEPFGASGPEELTRWPHIGLEPVPYAAMTLARDTEDGEEERPDDVLAGTAGDGGVEGGEGGAGGAGGGEGLPGGDPDGTARAAVLQEEIAALLENLDSDGRTRLLAAFREVLDSGGVGGSPDRAIARLVQRARESEGRDRAAATMLGLVSRIGKQISARGAAKVSPGTVLRELVNQLSGELTAGVGAASEAPETIHPVWVGELEPERILQLGVELAEITAPAQRAMKELAAGARAGAVAALLEGAPEGNPGAEEVREWMARPKNLRRLMAAEPPDLEAIDRLVALFGTAAAEPLLEVCVATASGEARAELVRRLIGLGSEVGPPAVARLTDPAPEVRSAMLDLLRGLPERPADFHPSAFYLDNDRGVRRQAMEFGLSLAGEREKVLYTALRDPDPGIVAFALAETTRACPPGLIPRLIQMATDGREPGVMRRAGIRALAVSDAPEVLEALIDLTWRRRVFVIYALAPKNSEMLEALGVLTARWSTHPRVRRIIAKARKSKDPQIRAVAEKSAGSADRTDRAGAGPAGPEGGSA